MRYGCCANMLVPPASGSGIAVAAAVAAAGFDYLELPVRRLAALPAAEFAALGARLRELGLPCETGNDFLPAAVPVVGPAANRAQQLAYVAEACARASAVGIRTVVFGSADARRRPDSVAPATAVAQIRDFLVAIIPLLRQHLRLLQSLRPLRYRPMRRLPDTLPADEHRVCQLTRQRCAMVWRQPA